MATQGGDPAPLPTAVTSASSQTPNVNFSPVGEQTTVLQAPTRLSADPPSSPLNTSVSSTAAIYDTSTPAIESTRRSTSVATISSSTLPSATSTAQSAVHSSAGSGLGYGAKLAAIIVPTLVVLALIPIIYICYIRRRYKKGRRESAMPEVHQKPPEASLLHAHHPSHDSVSLPTQFTDSERANYATISATWDHHQEDASRAPSPVLPSPSRHTFHAQEQWPLSGPLPEPPPPPPKYVEDGDNERPPSSNYGSRQAMLPRTPSEHDALVSPQEQGFDHDLAIKNRQSDAVSELSFDSRSRKHRTKSMDGESLVSAMEEEPVHDPMPARHIV